MSAEAVGTTDREARRGSRTPARGSEIRPQTSAAKHFETRRRDLIGSLIRRQGRYGTVANLTNGAFESADDFVSMLAESRRESRFLYRVDDSLAPTGWVASFRYHERPGYRGVARLVADVITERARPESAEETLRELIACGERRSADLGTHTLVCFLSERMEFAATCYLDSGFERQGGISTRGGERMRVYLKRIGK